MNEKPDFVKNFDRPRGTEIKCISGHWYLYERLSVYDPVAKKKRKKSGKILGTITPGGLVPSRRQSPLARVDPADIENRELGATALLYLLTGWMRKRLGEEFPDCWKEIYALAMAKCRDNSPLKRADFHTSTSALDLALGPLHLSAGRCTELLRRVGSGRGAIRRYMLGDSPRGGSILVDGHRIISASKSLEYARKGYDSRLRFLPQVNLMYIFSGADGGSRLPLFYKQFPGNIPDVTAFGETVEESGLGGAELTAVGDKGMDSALNEDLLEEAGLRYVLAVRRNCVGGAIPSSPGEYPGAFAFRERAIRFCRIPRETSDTYLYYDMSLANSEATDLILRAEKENAARELRIAAEERRREKGKGMLSDRELEELRPRDVADVLRERQSIGTVALRTNRKDLGGKEIYSIYKARQEIEQSFKFYDNNLTGDASYMRDEHSFEGWLFVNHLALQMLYSVIGLVAEKRLTDRYSFGDVMSLLKEVRMNKISGVWGLSKTTKKTAALCKKLDLDLEKLQSFLAT